MSMDGRDYVATVRLSTRDNDTLADPGERCDRVPVDSLPWLAEQKLIVLAPDAAIEPAKRRAKGV